MSGRLFVMVLVPSADEASKDQSRAESAAASKILTALVELL